jgi:hypothetical protein
MVTRNSILANQATVALHGADVLFPPFIHSHYREVPFEDVREGMEDMWCEHRVTQKSGSNNNTYNLQQMGTITSARVDSDGDLRLKTLLVGQQSGHIVYKSQETDTLVSCSRALQRYVWRKMDFVKLATMHGADVDKRIFQSHFISDNNYVTKTYDFQEHGHRSDVGNRNWHELLTHVTTLDESTFAVYELVPSPAKVLRAPEDIPPMPGGKPVQPQPGAGDAPVPAPAEGYEDGIPPMPGGNSGNNVTLPGKEKDNSGPLNDAWWGTENGD